MIEQFMQFLADSPALSFMVGAVFALLFDGFLRKMCPGFYR